MNYQGTWAANRNIMAVLASAAASAGRCPKQLRYLGEADRNPSTHRNRTLMGGYMVVKWW